MPQDTPALHVYERAVLDEDNDSLTLLARQIAAGAVVLDLGMGTGGLGKYLAARQSVTWTASPSAKKKRSAQARPIGKWWWPTWTAPT
jgi:cyclopropane fatty-acyl-phospholipid synthase-like methyltransferase